MGIHCWYMSQSVNRPIRGTGDTQQYLLWVCAYLDSSHGRSAWTEICVLTDIFHGLDLFVACVLLRGLLLARICGVYTLTPGILP